MKFDVKIMYSEGYLPTPRCRKLRYRNKNEVISTEIQEASMEDLEKAFFVSEYDRNVTVYAYQGKLWSEECKNQYGDQNATPLEMKKDEFMHNSYYFGKYDLTKKRIETKEEVLERLREDNSKFLIVNDVLYRETEEPLYCINTFGLGHNHAGIGTSLSVAWFYNTNISKKAYFNALEFEKAKESAIQTALQRGDTNSIKHIEKSIPIKVYKPELVKRNPQQEHENENGFLNRVEDIISASDSSTEAALLIMSMVASK